MATNWQLIRESLNGMIDACEALEKLPIDDSDYWAAASNFQPDVNMMDFLDRFWRYPEGCARDIIRIRAHFGCDAKYPNPLARALVNTAIACAEAIGVPEEVLAREMPDLEPHCDSAGKSIASQVKAPVGIAKGWMVPGIARAIATHKETAKTETQV
jgi:hypothetical protein